MSDSYISGNPPPKYPLPPTIRPPTGSVPKQGQPFPEPTSGGGEQAQGTDAGVQNPEEYTGALAASSSRGPEGNPTATHAPRGPNLLAQPGLAGVVTEGAKGMASVNPLTGKPLLGVPPLPLPGLNITGSSVANLAAEGDPTAIIFLIVSQLLTNFEASGEAATQMIHSLQIKQKQETHHNIQKIQESIKAMDEANKISNALGITGKVAGAINLVISLVIIIVLVVLIFLSLFGGEAFEIVLIPALLAALIGLGLAIDQVSGGPIIGALGEGMTKLLEAMGMSSEVANILGPILIQVIIILLMLALILCGGFMDIAQAFVGGGGVLIAGGTEVGTETTVAAEQVAVNEAQAAAATAQKAATVGEEAAIAGMKVSQGVAQASRQATTTASAAEATAVDTASGVSSGASQTTQVITRLQQLSVWAQRFEGYVQGGTSIGQGYLQFQEAQARYKGESAQAEMTRGQAVNELLQNHIELWNQAYQQIIDQWQNIFKDVMELIKREGEARREIAKTAKV